MTRMLSSCGLVRTGIEKRDADMRGKNFLDTDLLLETGLTFVRAQ